jgi:hypothetical protein
MNCFSLEPGNRSFVPSRRNFLRRCAFAAGGIGLAQCADNAFSQIVKKIVVLPILPAAGDVQVESVDVNTNSLAVGLARDNGVCVFEVAGGIHIHAVVKFKAKPNTQPAYFGVMKFLQVTHFKHRRSPAGLTYTAPTAGYACAQSKAPWELDGQYPYQNRSVRCVNGQNTIDLADAPNVPVEDNQVAYETMEVAPGDTFESWLIWEQTENNDPPTAMNAAKQYVLARVDWTWKGEAGDQNSPNGALCASTKHAGHGWLMKGQEAQVLRILKGSAAGTPPLPNKIPTANPNIWGPAC